MRLCKKAPKNWWVVDDSSTAAGRFDQPGSLVTDVQGGEHEGQVDNEDNVYIVEQIDAACQRYPDSTWKTDVTLSTAGEQVQAMMREARSRVKGEQKGARKATRTRKAGSNLFTALEPSLGSNPNFRMRQEAFGPNELEDYGGAYLPLHFYGTF
eukprot:6188000-Pleurochrysis_carterae.AAC.2